MLTKNKVLNYSLKVWLTGVVLSPLMYVIMYSIAHGIRVSPLSILLLDYAYNIGCNSLYSIPAWLLFFALLNPVTRLKLSISNKRTLVIIIGLLLIVATFKIVAEMFPGVEPPDYTFLAICHCIITGRCMAVYKLNYGKNYEQRAISFF